MKALAICIALALGGCALGEAQTKVKGAADTAAEALLTAACGVTVGAYFRLRNSNQQRGLQLLCGPGGQDLKQPEELMAEKMKGDVSE